MEIVIAVWDGRSSSLFSSCWDGLRGVLSGWIEMNFDDDVEGSNQSLGDSSRNQRKIVVRGIIIVLGHTHRKDSHAKVDFRMWIP